MSFSYWFINTVSWLHLIAGVILGVIGWRKYGEKAEKIWKNLIEDKSK